MEQTLVPAAAITSADFVACYEHYYGQVLGYLKKNFAPGDEHQAEDFAQDTFLKAWRALSSGVTIPPAALGQWLYRIAANTGTDGLRRRRLITFVPLAVFGEDHGVDDQVPTPRNSSWFTYTGSRFEHHVAEYEIVHRVLGKLPAIFVTCLLLHEHEGYSCDEIAATLGITTAAVKMRLLRARQQFIALYNQEIA